MNFHERYIYKVAEELNEGMAEKGYLLWVHMRVQEKTESFKEQVVWFNLEKLLAFCKAEITNGS